MRHYRTHGNVKPFECSVCQQSFGRKDLRDRHERNVHQTTRPPIARRTSDGLPTISVDPKPSPVRASHSTVSPETQRLCLDLFFRCFATTMPLIHQPTFNPDKRGSGLIRTMVAVGGSFSTDADVRSLSRQIYLEEWLSMRQLFVTLAMDDPRSFDVVSEVLILTFFGLSQLDQLHFDDSRNVFFESLQFARKFGMNSPLVTTAMCPPETLHQRWLEWVKYESFKRLSLHYFVTDALLSSVLNTSPQMSLLEMRQNLPVDELIWNAQSADDWQNICMSTSANTESPILDAMHHLVNSFHVPIDLNELSAILLSACLMTHISELSSWQVLCSSQRRSSSRRQQQLLQRRNFPSEFCHGQEIGVRSAQLKFAMNVLLDRARNQRMASYSSSQLWDVTSAIQQLGYLRLYLPSPQTAHGIVSKNWCTGLKETMTAIVGEDLGIIEYRPITLLLNWFIELMLSQVHLMYQGSSPNSGESKSLPPESAISCVACVQAMVDLWRLVRYTALHEAQMKQTPEMTLARTSFINTVKELSESVLGPSKHSMEMVPEDEFARTLSQLCSNMHQVTKMGTFKIASEAFGDLVNLLHGERPSEQFAPNMGAWKMISRCF